MKLKALRRHYSAVIFPPLTSMIKLCHPHHKRRPPPDRPHNSYCCCPPLFSPGPIGRNRLGGREGDQIGLGYTFLTWEKLAKKYKFWPLLRLERGLFCYVSSQFDLCPPLKTTPFLLSHPSSTISLLSELLLPDDRDTDKGKLQWAQ